MTVQGTIDELQNADVIDRDGDKVGTVGQLYLTNDTDAPSWVTVNTGFFGTKESFIPLAEATYADGTIPVPYEKSFIKDAPNVDEHGEISVEQEDELYRYYRIDDGATSSMPTRPDWPTPSTVACAAESTMRARMWMIGALTTSSRPRIAT